MSDFNETIGENPKMMAKILAAGNLIDVHVHKHENITKILQRTFVVPAELTTVSFPYK